jgi:hypothetical protein
MTVTRNAGKTQPNIVINPYPKEIGNAQAMVISKEAGI